MKINVLTIFPELFEQYVEVGMIKKAIDNGILQFNIIDFREYSNNKHKKVDDYPYSGSAGMLLMVQPIDEAIVQNNLENTHTIFPSPVGEVFNSNKAIELSKYDEITFIAGRYEGVDERVIKLHVDEQISIGDYILTGGELSIQVIIDALCRYIPEVLGNDCSAHEDSFSNGLLEHPQYTRPQTYKGLSVPKVLINGNHKLIEKYERYEQLKRTYKYRKDLLDVIQLSKEDEIMLAEIKDKLEK